MIVNQPDVGGLPNDHDAKKAIKQLEQNFDWIYVDNPSTGSHVCGFLRCGAGCQISVNKTAGGTALFLWRQALKCTHGREPTKRKP